MWPRQWGMESCLTMKWNSVSTCSAWRMRQNFQKWYFGHFHEDAEVEEVFVCLYDEVVELS